MEKIKRFLEPLKAFPYQYGLLIINTAFGLILNLATIRMIGTISDLILLKDISSIYRYSIYYGCIILGFYLLSFIGSGNSRRLRANTVTYIKTKYQKKIIELDNNYFEGLGTGKVISILDSGVFTRTELISQSIYFGFGSLITLIGSYYFISKIGLYPLLFSIFFLIISIILFYCFNGILNKYKKERKELHVLISKNTIKTIMSKFEVQLNNKIEHENKILEGFNNKQIELINKDTKYQWIVQNIPQFILDAGKLAIILIIGIGAIKGDYTPGEFVIFITVLSKLEGSIHETLSFMMRFSQQIIDVEKLREMTDNAPTSNKRGDETFIQNKGNIVAKGIVYSYPGGTKVFEDFSIDIGGGKKTALVGLSGSGKTTLMKLIAGFLIPDQGQIYVDGQNINSINLLSYYEQIGYLTQDPSVFDGTIMENLTYGLSNKTDLEISRKASEVLKLSQCERIYDLKDGLDTEIGEKGIRLSGGQKQRLAIAKLMLKDPSIILLDEPTSALDSFSEDEVTKALNNLFKNRTVIIIAHRLQTVKHADEIIVLGSEEQGTQILERGKHTELVKKGGFYAKMLELQSGF